MKLFGKVILALAVCIIAGRAVSAAAYVAGHGAYNYAPHRYYAPNYPIYVSESHGYVKGKMTRYFEELPAPVPTRARYRYDPYPAVRHVQYGVRTYPVYGHRDEVSYVPYVRKPYLYRNMYVEAPRPGPVILPRYWREMHDYWW